MNIFSSKRDAEIIAEGGFLCQACVVAKPLDDLSPDDRYCQGCYDFLMAEAAHLHESKRPKWVPRISKRAAEKSIPVSLVGSGNMSTVKDEETKVDIIAPKTRNARRGPKVRILPELKIRQLAAAGMGAKAIAREIGGIVSYRTILRVLSGQRVLMGLEK